MDVAQPSLFPPDWYYSRCCLSARAFQTALLQTCWDVIGGRRNLDSFQWFSPEVACSDTSDTYCTTRQWQDEPTSLKGTQFPMIYHGTTAALRTMNTPQRGRSMNMTEKDACNLTSRSRHLILLYLYPVV